VAKYSVPFLVILLCISLSTTFPCRAATVWSDNFDDGNYNGWFDGETAFSAEDGTLKIAPGAFLFELYHLSYVTTGTWSFDVIVGKGMDIRLLYNAEGERQSLTLSLYGTHILLYSYRSFSDSESVRLGEFILPQGMSGWQHIDVTRDSDGRNCVYINGTLIMDVVDNAAITSEFFYFLSYGESAIDNVVVSNTVDIEPPPQIPFYMQMWFIETVSVVAVAAAIITVLFLRRRK
jgi:hypothetical protein